MDRAQLEIEAKFRCHQPREVEARLGSLGFQPQPSQVQTDTYLGSPDRDFARTDEALRLRQVGTSNRLTYKGPKLGVLGKSRREVEVDLAEGEDVARNMLDLFQAIGFRMVRQVRKTRTMFPIPPGTLTPFSLQICLDKVEGLGWFLELETSGTIEDNPTRQAALQALASQLGLGPEERRSYLELLLEQDQKASP